MGIDKSITWKPKKLENLAALNVLVFGGTGGLGRAITRELALAGAQVTVIGQTFRDKDVKNIRFVKADLSSIKLSRSVARELDVSSTDIVLFTTGIFAASQREETPEGLERDMAVSYLNRIAIIREIVPKMKVVENLLGFVPRVFVMAYPGAGQLGTINDLNQEKSYGAMKAHMNTVAGNESLVYDSVAKYKGTHFFGLNPGLVKTEIRSNFLGSNTWKSKITETLIGWFSRSAEQYAKDISPLLFAPELEKHNGAIFDSYGRALFPSKGLTTEYAKEYVKASESLMSNKGLD